ncbi:MAG: hypothetical protein ACJATT_004774 [Myxococcota bacterium]|jgi:hypothetical protein
MRFTLLAVLLALPAIANAGYRASSERQARGNNAPNWGVTSALDSDGTTAWMVDPERDNVGSWIEIDIPKGEVDKVALIIGWDRDEDVFNDYARVQTLKIEVFDEAASDSFMPKLEHSITFTDQRGWQTIDIPNVAVGNDFSGGRIRMTVVDVFDGKDYPNLAVSGALVHLVEMDALATMDTPPTSSHDDHFPDALLDGSDRTYWSAGPDGAATEFTVAASGFGVSSVGITPGPRTHKRPKTIEIRANNVTQTVELPENARTMTWFDIAPLSGFTGSGFDEVRINVTETWPGSSVDELAIAEVKLRATNYSGI